MGTPQARIIRETINYWFPIARALVNNGKLVKLVTAWEKAYRSIKRESPDRAIKGFISNLIRLLKKLNWDPVYYDFWKDPQGNWWKMDNASSSTNILANELVRAADRTNIARAAQFYNGTGMHEGIEWDISLSLVRSYRGKTQDYPRLCALQNIIASAMWPASRVHEAFPLTPDMCLRCGEREDLFHTFWGCACNSNIEDDSVQSTQKYIPDATREVTALPCLWLRGILPYNKVKLCDDHPPPQRFLKLPKTLFYPPSPRGCIMGMPQGVFSLYFLS